MNKEKVELTYWKAAKIPTVQYGSRDICLTLKSLAEPGNELEEYMRLKEFVDQRIEEQASQIANDQSKLRIRTKDSKKYPSVTSILSPDPINVPHIEKYGLKGTFYHKMANLILEGMNQAFWPKDLETPDISPLKWDIDIKAFFDKFGSKFGQHTLNKEVFHEKHIYSGEIDFIGNYDGKLTIGDFKTGTWKLEQLIAYAKAYEKNVDQIAIFDLKNCEVHTWGFDLECGWEGDAEVVEAWENFLKLRGAFKQRFGI